MTSTKRYSGQQDSDLYTINSPELADLGEVDMGDGQSLYDFATWAIDTYPAEHRALILRTTAAAGRAAGPTTTPVAGSRLTMQEIDAALGAVVADTGIGALDLVGFDACLMGQLEVMSAIAPHAQYAVASAETEPAIGWGYAGFLRALTENPSMTGRELSSAIVDSLHLAGHPHHRRPTRAAGSPAASTPQRPWSPNSASTPPSPGSTWAPSRTWTRRSMSWR